MKATLLSAISLVMVLIASCTEDRSGNQGPVIYIEPIGEARNYILAAAGSYWVYKNTLSGAVDTLRMVDFNVELIRSTTNQRNGDDYQLEHDKVFMTMSSSYSNQAIHENTNDFFADPYAHVNNKVILLRRMNSGAANVFFYPFIDGETVFNTTYRGMDATMHVQGREYQKVARFEVEADPSWEGNAPYPNAIYYFAEGVGLIKREAPTRGDSWELVHSNVINVQAHK